MVTWVNETPPEGDRRTLGAAGCASALAPDDLRRIAALVATYVAAPQEQAESVWDSRSPVACGFRSSPPAPSPVSSVPGTGACAT